MSDDGLRLGLVGCGGFGLFAVDHFMKVRGVSVARVADTDAGALAAAVEKLGVPGVLDAEELAAAEDVDLVYIAAPPFLHHSQAIAALKQGKHVICEKPLAVNLEQADEMIALARERDLLLAVDLMQRYNPAYRMVGRVVESGVLGEPLHAYFENYATDETLPVEHWFWDRAKSGGIFVEHGVHFFDMFEGWFGPGKVEAAQVCRRPGSGVEDQVHCTVRYGDAMLANFYHGFTQARRMDRQEIGILFERGDVTLNEWVPTRVRIRAIIDDGDTDVLRGLFPGSRVEVVADYDGDDRHCRARGKDLEVSRKVELVYGEGIEKSVLYGEILRAMIQDQFDWIRERSHSRLVTEENGRRSLAMAVEADRLAR